MSELNGYRTSLSEVRNALSEMRHDINNPLAIISGNVQYLLEVARAAEYGDQVSEPLQDIEEASRQITNSLQELDEIQESLPPEAAPSQAAPSEAASSRAAPAVR